MAIFMKEIISNPLSLGVKKFPGLRSQTPGEVMDNNSTNFGLTRKPPRCSQCLKYCTLYLSTMDSELVCRIAEDEFGRCAICKKVNFCSKICANKYLPFHALFCEDIQTVEAIKLNGQGEWQFILKGTPSERLDKLRDAHSSLYLTAIMEQNYELCEEYLNLTSKKILKSVEKQMHNGPTTFPLNNLRVTPVLLTLGRDQEAYSFLKYWYFSLQDIIGALTHGCIADYEMFKSMVKSDENPKICWENFFEQEFFTHIKKVIERPQVDRYIIEALLCLVILKINVIEEMKNKLNERDKFFKQNSFKSKRKFKDYPRILEGLTILSLGVGMDGKSFTEELRNQKDQLYKLLNFLMKKIKGKPRSISFVWLAIGGDCRNHFIENYEKEDIYFEIGFSGLFALIKYFDKHPTASQIILQYMENKIGFKVEKNFYVTLETLPKNSFGLFDSGL